MGTPKIQNLVTFAVSCPA